MSLVLLVFYLGTIASILFFVPFQEKTMCCLNESNDYLMSSNASDMYKTLLPFTEKFIKIEPKQHLCLREQISPNFEAVYIIVYQQRNKK